MGDIVGGLSREFALTLSAAILVSAVVSLTLTPMLCAKLLKPVADRRPGAFARAAERQFDNLVAIYGRTLRWGLGHQTEIGRASCRGRGEISVVAGSLK